MANSESEHYFVLDKEQKIAGFLKCNWGRPVTEQELKIPLKFNEFMCLPPIRGLGLGKEMFEFALEEAEKRGFSWVYYVWERNFKAQNFYFKYGFERFSQHEYIT